MPPEELTVPAPEESVAAVIVSTFPSGSLSFAVTGTVTASPECVAAVSFAATGGRFTVEVTVIAMASLSLAALLSLERMVIVAEPE